MVSKIAEQSPGTSFELGGGLKVIFPIMCYILEKAGGSRLVQKWFQVARNGSKGFEKWFQGVQKMVPRGPKNGPTEKLGHLE